MRYLLVALCVFLFLGSNAQDPTWASDIAPLVYDNCSHCHHEGQIAPFSIMSYEDVVDNSLQMYFAMEDGHMPPWPADPNYVHFVGETIVTEDDVDMFLDWVESGMPFGNTDDEPAAPVFESNGTLLDHVDYTLEVPSYELQSDNEEYRWFVFETDFEETVFVNGIEVITNLPEIVHHCDIFYDVTGNSLALDEQSELPGFNGSQGWPTNSYYMNAWQPGAGPAVYPEGWGIAVPPGADFVIEVHYGPEGETEVDNTQINLQFVTDTDNVRPISVGWLMGSGSMTDGPLIIPPEQVVTFHQEVTPFWQDKSLISICPHMHLLGKSYKVWMETPEGETVPLIDIPEWDFHWQFYYTFQQIVKVPAGSVFKSEGVYDNTSQNENNPNTPPITVYDGAWTTDEMFLCYFIYAPYLEGDENIILDPELSVGDNLPGRLTLDVFPNPAQESINLSTAFLGQVQIEIVNAFGQQVHNSMTVVEYGEQLNIPIEGLGNGQYFIVVRQDRKQEAGGFVKL